MIEGSDPTPPAPGSDQPKSEAAAPATHDQKDESSEAGQRPVDTSLDETSGACCTTENSRTESRSHSSSVARNRSPTKSNDRDRRNRSSSPSAVLAELMNNSKRPRSRRAQHKSLVDSLRDDLAAIKDEALRARGQDFSIVKTRSEVASLLGRSDMFKRDAPKLDVQRILRESASFTRAPQSSAFSEFKSSLEKLGKEINDLTMSNSAHKPSELTIHESRLEELKKKIDTKSGNNYKKWAFSTLHINRSQNNETSASVADENAAETFGSSVDEEKPGSDHSMTVTPSLSSVPSTGYTAKWNPNTGDANYSTTKVMGYSRPESTTGLSRTYGDMESKGAYSLPTSKFNTEMSSPYTGMYSSSTHFGNTYSSGLHETGTHLIRSFSKERERLMNIDSLLKKTGLRGLQSDAFSRPTYEYNPSDASGATSSSVALSGRKIHSDMTFPEKSGGGGHYNNLGKAASLPGTEYKYVSSSVDPSDFETGATRQTETVPSRWDNSSYNRQYNNSRFDIQMPSDLTLSYPHYSASSMRDRTNYDAYKDLIYNHVPTQGSDQRDYSDRDATSNKQTSNQQAPPNRQPQKQQKPNQKQPQQRGRAPVSKTGSKLNGKTEIRAAVKAGAVASGGTKGSQRSKKPVQAKQVTKKQSQTYDPFEHWCFGHDKPQCPMDSRMSYCMDNERWLFGDEGYAHQNFNVSKSNSQSNLGTSRDDLLRLDKALMPKLMSGYIPGSCNYNKTSDTIAPHRREESPKYKPYTVQTSGIPEYAKAAAQGFPRDFYDPSTDNAWAQNASVDGENAYPLSANPEQVLDPSILGGQAAKRSNGNEKVPSAAASPQSPPSGKGKPSFKCKALAECSDLCFNPSISSRGPPRSRFKKIQPKTHTKKNPSRPKVNTLFKDCDTFSNTQPGSDVCSDEKKKAVNSILKRVFKKRSI